MCSGFLLDCINGPFNCWCYELLRDQLCCNAGLQFIEQVRDSLSTSASAAAQLKLPVLAGLACCSPNQSL